jgi:phosphomannomutase
MNYNIFKAYDIRGVYPTDLDEEAFYRIALAYAAQLKPKNVAVGMDARLSSPSLKEKVVQGLLDSGVDVVEVGEVTTDMIYFAVGAYNYSGGIIVSASHNPGEYNGMKMVREKVAAISSDTGLFDIRDALKEGKIGKPALAKPGVREKKDILDDYVEKVLSFIDKSAIRPFKFVANGNFGFVGKSVRKIVEVLGLTMIPLNFDPDGSFPKGPPDPMLPGNRRETEALIRSSNADFGVAWDADADRVMFFDEKGQFIHGVYTTAFLAKILLEKYGCNNTIIFDPRVVWPIQRVVDKMGGTPVIYKSGHAFMKDKMRSLNALFAGELSAHYYFRDMFYADNGIIPFLLVMEYLSKSGKKLSEIIAPFMEGHYMTGELNYEVKSIPDILEKVKQRFHKDGEENLIDGYSLESKEWRFNIRPSNTQPLLRLNVEARKPGLVDKIKNELLEIING